MHEDGALPGKKNAMAAANRDEALRSELRAARAKEEAESAADVELPSESLFVEDEVELPSGFVRIDEPETP